MSADVPEPGTLEYAEMVADRYGDLDDAAIEDGIDAEAAAHRERPDNLRERLAEAHFTAEEWSGCAGSMWSRLPEEYRRRRSREMECLLPIVAEREAAAEQRGAERALRDAADALGHVWQADTINAAEVYRALRDRADRIGEGK